MLPFSALHIMAENFHLFVLSIAAIQSLYTHLDFTGVEQTWLLLSVYLSAPDYLIAVNQFSVIITSITTICKLYVFVVYVCSRINQAEEEDIPVVDVDGLYVY